MGKLNLVELLRDCPTGMELDSTVFDNVTFDYVNTQQNRVYCKVGKSESVWFTPKGGVNLLPDAKCVIFPKGKTTWEEFHRPFEDGDIVATNDGGWIGITVGGKNGRFIPTYCVIKSDGTFEAYFGKKEKWHFERLATEEEKQKLFDAIKANGYRWNTETKTLKKLIEPKFKVGDTIRHKESGNILKIAEIDISDSTYCCGFDCVWVADQDKYELVPNKFDITTLKAFDKVLVRNTNTEYWRISLFGAIVHDDRRYFMCLANSGFKQCIPYEHNEHLLGTSNDCDPFFKTWEK